MVATQGACIPSTVLSRVSSRGTHDRNPESHDPPGGETIRIGSVWSIQDMRHEKREQPRRPHPRSVGI